LNGLYRPTPARLADHVKALKALKIFKSKWKFIQKSSIR
jgi:hypothetical protein